MVAAFHKRGCKRNRKAGRIVNQAQVPVSKLARFDSPRSEWVETARRACPASCISSQGIVQVSQRVGYVHEERRGNLYCSERRKVGQWPDSWCHGCSCMCTDQSGTAIDTPNVQPVLHCSSLSWIFAKSSRTSSVSLLFVGCVKGAVGKKKEERKKEKRNETWKHVGLICARYASAQWTRLVPPRSSL